MKQFLLLLAAVVLACGLVISCAQPSSFDITLKAGDAPEVIGESIKYVALQGANLVRWDGSDEHADYIIYRKTLDTDGNPVDSSILQLASSASQTLSLKLWYYLDNGIKAGEKYQYGIVAQGYKAGTDVLSYSGIVWQEGEGYATAAIVPEVGTKYQVPADAAGVKITITPIKAVSSGVALPTGTVETADTILIKAENLDLNYDYKLHSQASSLGTELGYAAITQNATGDITNELWGTGQTGGTPWDRKISNYIENGGTVSLTVLSGWGTSWVSADTTTRRVVIQYDTAINGGVLEYKTANTAVTNLDDNQKVAGAIPRS
jgi:hypothetical protein